MITAKITSKAQEGQNVRYWYQILQDGKVFEDGLSVIRGPEDTKDYVKNQILNVKERFVKAEKMVEDDDSLINLEL